MNRFYFLSVYFLLLSCSSNVEDSAEQPTENAPVVTDTIIKEEPLYCNADVVVAGKQKWDTRQEAEKAGALYIQQKGIQ